MSALALAVLSWWINARKGRLKSSEPRSFSAIADPQPHLGAVVLPLVFHNTGAKPIVVQNLRVSLPEQPDLCALVWNGTRSSLSPSGEFEQTLPAVFAVPARDVVEMFAEFRGPLEAGSHKVAVEAEVGHRKRWQPVVTFTLHAASVTGLWSTYLNAPAD